jgi:DnaA family protein
LSRPPPPTLDNFAVGRNVEAVTTLRAWLAGTLHERCIYLWGPSGSGKTHLLRAAVDAARTDPRSSLYVEPAGLPGLETLPRLLAVDGADRMVDAEQAALFRLYQRLTEDDSLLLASGAVAPAALALRDDLRTRLASGLIFQLHLLTDEEKVEALRSHAAGRGFELPSEIAEYLLHRRQRDLPALMAVLDALDQYSLRSHRPITLPLLREMLSQSASRC